MLLRSNQLGCSQYARLPRLATVFTQQWGSSARLSRRQHNHRVKFMKNYTARKVPLMYSFSGNCAASVPISNFYCTFMCLWAIYLFQGLVHIFHAAEQTNRLCNPFLGIFVSNFWYWFFAVYTKNESILQLIFYLVISDRHSMISN